MNKEAGRKNKGVIQKEKFFTYKETKLGLSLITDKSFVELAFKLEKQMF